MTDTHEKYMQQTDAFAWEMEHDPLLRSTVVAATIYEKSPDWDHLERKVDIMTRVITGFRQKVVVPPLGLATPRWTFDSDFDLSWHLRRLAAPAPKDLDAVLKMARDLGMSAFDKDRPLWEMHLVEDMQDGRAALLLKVHHSLTDGVGGVQVAMLLFDLTADAPLPEEVPPAPAGEHLSNTDVAIEALRMQAGDVVGAIASLPGAVLSSIRSPFSAIRNLADVALSIGKMSIPPTDTKSPVMTQRTLGWRYCTLLVPLSGLKKAAKAADGKMNDAYIAGLLGGLHRYHERHGYDVAQLRINMPVNLRVETDKAGGNRINLLRFPIPANVADPVARIHEVHRLVQAWRDEPANPHVQKLAAVLRGMPEDMMRPMLKHLDFLASNVPGFPIPVFLGGAKLEAIYPFGPTLGTAVNFTLMSYLDECGVGVTIDVGAIPDQEDFVSDIQAGFEEVLALGGEHAPVTVTSPASLGSAHPGPAPPHPERTG